MKMKVYACIDLKTFYASVECVERGLDPFCTNLVVADKQRGRGALCLAISPSLKSLGIRNRCRIYEIPSYIDYLIAKPRMQMYIDYAATIYGVYLEFVAKEDIHVYSIDEAFIDLSSYLKFYKQTPYELVQTMMTRVYQKTGISASSGIGTNLYLAKIALDILAKHQEDGIAYLNESLFKEQLGEHQPLTDFWQIGKGIQRRLHQHHIYTMNDIINTSSEVLYKEFGILSEAMIDHAKGKEIVSIQDIKQYRSVEHSKSKGQVLFEDYNYQDAWLIVKEMVEGLCLELSGMGLVSNHIALSIRYSNEQIRPTGGSMRIDGYTNLYSQMIGYFKVLYQKKTVQDIAIRQVSISMNHLKPKEYFQYTLFDNVEEIEKEKQLQEALHTIQYKYGKNAVLKGMNMQEKATMKKRNLLIGGHNRE